MKVCIFSAASIGGTFLDWSIHFLSGQTKYFSTPLNQFIPLSMNPVDLKKNNSHNHLKNHPDGAELTNRALQLCDTSTGLYSMYTQPIYPNVIAKDKDLKFTKENFDKITKYREIDTQELFLVCNQHNAKIIHLGGESAIPLYLKIINRYDTLTEDELSKRRNQFKNSNQLFFDEDLTQIKNIWDLREIRALNSRPFDAIMEYQINHPHLKIDCREFWTNGEDVIHRIMKYIGFTIDQTRLNSWRTIYRNWQKIHVKPMSFNYNCKHIVDAIVNNWSYEIDLTFNEEVVIQHLLIYKHNLNLKTWQLEKFPNNTQQLHTLLEPNIHPVDNIY